MSSLKKVYLSDLPLGKIKKEDDFYIFYDNNNIGDLIIDIERIQPKKEINVNYTYQSFIPGTGRFHLEINTFSGRYLRCFIDKNCENFYDVSYIDIK